MRLKNKAPTWYRDGKVTFAPGEVKEMSDHDGQELLNKLPWHFEAVKAEKPAAKPKEVAPPPPPKEEPAFASEEPRRYGRGRSRE